MLVHIHQFIHAVYYKLRVCWPGLLNEISDVSLQQYMQTPLCAESSFALKRRYLLRKWYKDHFQSELPDLHCYYELMCQTYYLCLPWFVALYTQSLQVTTSPC